MSSNPLDYSRSCVWTKRVVQLVVETGLEPQHIKKLLCSSRTQQILPEPAARIGLVAPVTSPATPAEIRTLTPRATENPALGIHSSKQTKWIRISRVLRWARIRRQREQLPYSHFGWLFWRRRRVGSGQWHSSGRRWSSWEGSACTWAWWSFGWWVPSLSQRARGFSSARTNWSVSSWGTAPTSRLSWRASESRMLDPVLLTEVSEPFEVGGRFPMICCCNVIVCLSPTISIASPELFKCTEIWHWNLKEPTGFCT